jgi:hypothetical protein
MKDFLLEALLKPLAAILFCLVFGLPFVYIGFQTVQVEGNGRVRCQRTIVNEGGNNV